MNTVCSGHADAGVLHVRPPLISVTAKPPVKLFKSISDQVADLTQKYGGLIWGEHAKACGEYSRKFFGRTVLASFTADKTLFDPDNRLNPQNL